jgi:effector-binding domain-containing protein
MEHKKLKETLVATVRLTLKQRAAIKDVLAELAQEIPGETIAGVPFCIFQFVSSVQDGYDVEAGFPVNQKVETGALKTRVLPAMEVLSIVHRGAPEKLGETYGKLYGYAEEHGIISDEFCREVYLDVGVEVQFVIHQWTERLAENLGRVLGEETKQVVLQGSDVLGIESSVDDRFRWVKGMVERLDDLADEGQKYDILSSCAHVFPVGQIAKLKGIYEETKAKTKNSMQAVDAVLDFMASDPGWSEERPLREGNVIYSAKSPRDPKGYENAKDDLERRRAYCFCPLVRNHMDQGIPTAFCYCGTGWYRQQWEGAISRPVTIEIVKSVLKGDEMCQFAIRLPEDL